MAEELVTLLGEPKKYGVRGDREQGEEKPVEPKETEERLSGIPWTNGGEVVVE